MRVSEEERVRVYETECRHVVVQRGKQYQNRLYHRNTYKRLYTRMKHLRRVWLWNEEKEGSKAGLSSDVKQDIRELDNHYTVMTLHARKYHRHQSKINTIKIKSTEATTSSLYA